ncbi:PA2779 family protein [Roseateles violae]|uniref:PA2779 family protein n=1 Tax=Roseateles violae TaxID=3058042 RepID=A0ABT8DPP6_9BURK|nr:PA2779 family protein [Pelomonas sp. PFR6]MDN3919953.1 PA2779 family protein [Pelomonas sp. PFR6]
MQTTVQRLIATTLIVSCSLLPLQASHAAIVPTEAALASAAAADADAGRATVKAFLAREDVRAALLQQGVDGEAAQARVDALSDAEIAELVGRVEQAPAGGEVLGLLFTVFIVLLVTDILGLTKVFPFTRSLR